jgi:L-lactate dehydrogenase complex protein LldE
MRVALFVPCFVDLFAPEVAVAAARVLRRLGHEVEVPEGQTCCGQPALNAGCFEEAGRLARRLLAILDGGEPEAVVCPSGSCVAALRRAGPEHPGLERSVLGRLHEFSEFLTREHGPADPGAVFHGTVAWHDGCHPLRELGIREGPRALLRAVRGLTLREIPAECCGFGGLFSVRLPEVSAAMGERKARAILSTGADCVTSTEPSCLLQIGGILRRLGSGVRTLHIAEILAGDRDE